MEGGCINNLYSKCSIVSQCSILSLIITIANTSNIIASFLLQHLKPAVIPTNTFFLQLQHFTDCCFHLFAGRCCQEVNYRLQDLYQSSKGLSSFLQFLLLKLLCIGIGEKLFDIIDDKNHIRVFIGLTIFACGLGSPLSEFLQICGQLTEGKLRSWLTLDVECKPIVLSEETTGRIEGKVMLAINEDVFVERLRLGMQEGHHEIIELDVGNDRTQWTLGLEEGVLKLDLRGISEEDGVQKCAEVVFVCWILLKNSLAGLKICLKEFPHGWNGIVIDILINFQQGELGVLASFLDESVRNTVFLIDDVRMHFFALLLQLDHCSSLQLKQISVLLGQLNEQCFTLSLEKYSSADCAVTISATCLSISFIFCRKPCLIQAARVYLFSYSCLVSAATSMCYLIVFSSIFRSFRSFFEIFPDYSSSGRSGRWSAGGTRLRSRQ